MKIAIKKKYLGGFATFVSGISGLLILQELWLKLSQVSFSELILPIIFLVSLLYTINYWSSFNQNRQIIDEASREAANYDPQNTESVKQHLWKKLENEAYTLNFFMGKIKITTSWAEQDKIEKIKSNKNIPKVIKKEFVKKI